MNHQGIVTCRGMLIEDTVYRRGDKLSEPHKHIVHFVALNVLDYITPNGWLSVGNGGHVNFVMFSSEQPSFLK